MLSDPGTLTCAATTLLRSLNSLARHPAPLARGAPPRLGGAPRGDTQARKDRTPRRRRPSDLLAESIEFPEARFPKEGAPGIRCEPQHRAIGVLAVTNADPAVRQAGYFHAVAVTKT